MRERLEIVTTNSFPFQSRESIITMAYKYFGGKDMDKNLVESFKKELELLKKLKHPNIVNLNGFCLEENR